MIWTELPLWVQYLTQGLLVFSLMSCAAVTLSRAGHSPYWAIFTVIPYFLVVGIWIFALCAWPKLDGKKPS